MRVLKKSINWGIILILILSPFMILNTINIDANIIGTVVGESSNDNFGFAVSNTGDVNDDGIDDIIVGAPGHNNSNGAVYIFFGGSHIEGDLSPANANITITGPQAGLISNSKFGYSVSNAGDINNDGCFDVIIGAPNSQNAYIYLGYEFPNSPLKLTYLDANITLNGSSQNGFGFSVGFAGDFNNDIYEDFMVGDPYYDQASSVCEGRVYIFYGKSSHPSTISYLNANITFEGDTKNDFFGWNVSYAGDLNSDGVSDIIIGAPYCVNGPNPGQDGAAYIYFGGKSYGTQANFVAASQANLTLKNGKNKYLGWSVANAGDVNNDKYDDVIVGAPLYDSARGCAYIYYGGKPMDNNIDIMLVGEVVGDNFGKSVSMAGDHDSDGKPDDFAVGAPSANNNGTVYIFYGADIIPSVISGANADTISIGETNFDEFGFTLSYAGSIIESHGSDNLMVGAPYYDDATAGPDTGKIYIFGHKSWYPITLPILEGWSFQNEDPKDANDTLKLRFQDNSWAPSNVPGYSDNNYATSSAQDWWDGLTVKFDMSMFAPMEYDAVLKFYARNHETNNCYGNNDNRYQIYNHYKNTTDEDAGPPNSQPVKGYPSLTDPLPDEGKEYERWYKYRIPDEWWSKGINWFTIRFWDGGVDAVKLIMVSTEIKTLYLHDDTGASSDISIPDELNTIPPTAITPLNVALSAEDQEFHRWGLAPDFATDFHILGDVDVVLWVSNTGNEDTSLEIALYEYLNPGFTKFAETTYELGNVLDLATCIQVELSAIDYTINKGNKLVLSATATGPAPGPAEFVIINFNSTVNGYSHIDLPTDTVIDISWVKTYDSNVKESLTFTVGDTMRVKANITDPFGSYDISGANIRIKAPNGSILVDGHSMNLEQSDVDDPSVWSLFNYTFNNPTASGIYTIIITAIESNGVSVQEITLFFLEPDVPYELIISTDPSTLIANGVSTSNLEMWLYDVYGNPIPGSDLDFQFSFDAGGGSFGTVTGYGNGYYNVTYTSPQTAEPDADIRINIKLISNTTKVKLEAGPLHHVIITPSSNDIVAGGSHTFDAVGYDKYNNEVPLTGTIWSTTVGTLSGVTVTTATLNAQTTTEKGYVNATQGGIVGSADANIVADVLDHINITPASANVSVNQIQVFNAVGLDIYDNVVGLKSTMWSTNVGMILEQNNDNAKFKAQVNAGIGYVNAREGTIARSVEVNVVPDSLYRIIISPNPINVTAGGMQEFTAVGYDKYDNIIPINPSWATNVGTMDGSTINAWTAVGAGYVNATFGAVSAIATVNIIPDALNYIIVTPNSVNVEVGKSEIFSAFGYDKYNNLIAIEPIWVSSVGVMAGQVLTAQQQVVQGYVNASILGITGSSVVHLIPGPLTKISISPADLDIVAGATHEFEAKGRDQYDNLIPINPVWYSTVGSMAGSTLLAKTNIGTGSVGATYMGINGNANVTIVPDDINYIFVAPPYVEIIAGQSQEFTAMGSDKYNNIIPITPIWTTDVGTMFGNVFFAQNMPGEGSVTATVNLNGTVNGISGTAEVKIIMGNFEGRPNIIGKIQDQERTEDCPPWVLYLTPYESDDIDSGKNLDWYVEGENTSMYILSGEYSDDDVLRFTPFPNAYGCNLITLWLVDSNDYKDYQKVWVNLTPVNDKPIIYGAPDLILHYDDPYTFNYEPYIYDVDNSKSKLTLSTAENTNDIFTSVNGFFVIFEYPQSMLGQEVFVRIVVSDGEVNSEDIIKVKITDDWVPKLTMKLPDIMLYEGSIIRDIFDLDDHFLDPDKDCLYYSYGETHVSVMINSNNTVDISSYSEWYGTDTVTFRAEDSMSALAEDTIIITVIPVNDPPTISGVPDLLVRYEYDYYFDLTSYIADEDNKFDELKISTSELSYIKFDENYELTMIINFPESLKGKHIAVTITVSDGLESSFQAITVTVSEDFPPEIRRPLPDIEFYEDTVLHQRFNLNDYFEDPDGDMLFYSHSQTQITLLISENSSVDFAAPPNWYGSESITFRAKDPMGALQEDTILVSVIPINDIPEIKIIPDQKGMVGQIWVFDLSDYIFDVESNITELELDVNKAFITISGLNMIFYSKQELTAEAVTITVGDGENSTAMSFLVTFTAPEEVITMSELFYWSAIIIILVIISSLIFVYKGYKGKYKIEEAFLIYKDGTLLFHKTNRKGGEGIDDDILSGMLTAVQSFVKEGFGYNASTSYPISPHPYHDSRKIDEWQLQELKVQGHDILLEHGKYAYIALLYSGSSGWKLTRDVRNKITEIESRYAFILEHWEGNMNKIAGIGNLIEPLLANGNNHMSNLNFISRIHKK